VGVARGYLNRPELTAERFLPDPFRTEAEARMYKTGDLGRWLPDGNIEFLGRNDFQVKIRGFRVELGEIEARLAEHPGVREAVVVARQDQPDDQRLVAYVVPKQHDGNDGPRAEELRAYLSGKLPDYMVPALYVRLEAIPLSPNGKLDRKALPAPDVNAPRGYVAPQGEAELLMSEIWARVLGLAKVGRHDNFFELGGHSLLAVKVIEQLRRHGVQADIRALFNAPRLADLTAVIHRAESEVEIPPNLIPTINSNRNLSADEIELTI
jgi:aryl carrier-like protein